MNWRTFALVYLLAAVTAMAAAPTSARSRVEPQDTRWALSVDNDGLSVKADDRDYTGGFSLTVSGRGARHAKLSLDRVRSSVNRLLRIDRVYADSEYRDHSLELGLSVFSPGNLEDPGLQVGDRPYASLLYFASSGVDVVPQRDVAYLSTFTLGVLGMPFIDKLQRGLHRTIGAAEPVGWDKQISDGGELTFRYGFARVARGWTGSIGGAESELTTTWRASVGYLTEVSFGISSRSGRISSPWWSFAPQLADYAEKSVPLAATGGHGDEQYVWAGFNLRARAYNAFLQGQFRDSGVTFAHDELRPLVLEAWLGYTWAPAEQWRISYVLRGQTSELRGGPGDREMLWGSLIVSRSF